jgi:conjugative relaxase-like TrwC/TraI family protein
VIIVGSRGDALHYINEHRGVHEIQVDRSPAVLSPHKLMAGSGYTYLTRQVAANDASERGYASLGEYYSERGESPGVWLGRGLDGLDDGPAPGARVSEAQMIALFGHGRHPDADAREQAALAAGRTPAEAVVASDLGVPLAVPSGSRAFRRELARRLVAHNSEQGRPVSAAIDAEVRERLRTELGREWFVRDTGRVPRDARELTDYVTGASRDGRASVAGYDLSFSPVKSVSALWALAGPEVAGQVAAAHDAAVRDVIDWLEREVVYTRLGHDGVRQHDVRGLLAVAFTHRDSRAGDPDLHTHVAISNKVQTLDGRWRALDGRVLYRAAVAASERYNTRLEAQLVARLGVRFADRQGEDGKRPVREIAGVDTELARSWSKRRAKITARQDQLAAEFTRRHGRAPDFAEATRLYGRATIDTRQGKHAPRSEDEQRREWRRQAVDVLGSDQAVIPMLDAVWLGRRAAVVSSDASRRDWVPWTAAQAIATVAAERSTWRADHVRSEIERRARSAALPLVDLDLVVEQTLSVALSPTVSIKLAAPDEIDEPAVLRRRNGASVFTVAGSQLYTSAATLQAEQRLLDAASRLDGRSVDPATVELALLEARAGGTPLNEAQCELVRSLATSGARVQLALAPAGSGKTTAIGVLARAWTDDGGDVLGLAPSATAATQLRQAVGARSDTIAKLLHTVDSGADVDWVRRIGPPTLVIVDEAGLAGTGNLDRVVSFVLARGGSVRLVGDMRQLAAPQSGGVLRDIAEAVGTEGLSILVRFADPLEAHASLGLRDGDPVALGYYLDRDRVHAGDHASVLSQALAAWAADVAAGRDSLLLAATNTVVRELNVRARAERLTCDGAPVREAELHDGTAASAGDTVLTRRNNRRLLTSSTDWVMNGDRWHIDAVTNIGDLRVRHLETGRKITLPAAYARRYVELGYASTIHLAQGSTAQTCHTVLTGRESRESLYVAMTRGRVANHVYVDTAAASAELAAFTPDALDPPTSVEVLERVLANETAPRSASSQRRVDTDVQTRLRNATARYAEAVRVCGVDGVAAGPLPWLAALPSVGDPALAEYLGLRFELVRDLAAKIDVAAVLPAARWASALQQTAPELAGRVAVWRADHEVAPDDFRPCGPPGAGDYQRRLLAHVESLVGAMTGPTDRWQSMADKLVPSISSDPHWPVLADAFARADAAGYDVAARVPQLVARRPLPEQHTGRALYYRLIGDCAAAVAPRPAYRADSDAAVERMRAAARSEPSRARPASRTAHRADPDAAVERMRAAAYSEPSRTRPVTRTGPRR